MEAGEEANVTFSLREVLLKPGTYVVGLWLGRGSLEVVGSANRKILAYLRRDEHETILVVVNLSRSVQPADCASRALNAELVNGPDDDVLLHCLPPS